MEVAALTTVAVIHGVDQGPKETNKNNYLLESIAWGEHCVSGPAEEKADEGHPVSVDHVVDSLSLWRRWR